MCPIYEPPRVSEVPDARLLTRLRRRTHASETRSGAVGSVCTCMSRWLTRQPKPPRSVPSRHGHVAIRQDAECPQRLHSPLQRRIVLGPFPHEELCTTRTGCPPMRRIGLPRRELRKAGSARDRSIIRWPIRLSIVQYGRSSRRNHQCVAARAVHRWSDG